MEATSDRCGGSLVDDLTFNPYAPVRRKCTYWREQINDEERWDTRISAQDRRVDCTCFIEGRTWVATVSTIPSDCPERMHCRYYVRAP